MNESPESDPQPAEPLPGAAAEEAAAESSGPAEVSEVPEVSAELLAARDQVTALEGQIRRALVGQDEMVRQVLAALLAGGHVLLEGVPGVGKTLLALALARAFGGSFSRVQFTPDLMPADVTGHSIYRPETGVFEVRKGPVFAHLLLADEINRAPAKTQSALLEAMQEQQVTIEGESFPLPRPFLTLATQNPLEHEGTYPLPEAQLDRFLMKVVIDYPGEEDERSIVRRVTTGQTADRLDVEAVGAVADPESILTLQRTAGSLLVDDRILEYAVRVARRTRDWNGLRQGTGPRGGIALVRVARAFALLDGRDYVVPDDVKRAALPVLRHRVVVSPEVEMSGEGVDHVLEALLEAVEAPRR